MNAFLSPAKFVGKEKYSCEDRTRRAKELAQLCQLITQSLFYRTRKTAHLFTLFSNEVTLRELGHICQDLRTNRFVLQTYSSSDVGLVQAKLDIWRGAAVKTHDIQR